MNTRSILCAALVVASCGPSATQVKSDTTKVAQQNAEPKPLPPPVTPPKAPEPDPWANADLFVAPTINPSTKVDLGQVERFTLPNGMKVIVVPRHQVPDVAVMVAVQAGDFADPLGKSGLASFTGQMLRKGTATRTADQISDAIDFVGGSLDFSSDDDASMVSCSARTRDLGLCLDLVSDIVANPTFPEAEMKEVHDALVASVDGARDNPRELADQHVDNLFYGDDDIRGRTVSKKSIAALDRNALVEFHKTWYAPNNAVIAVAGDVDAKAIKAELEKAFAGWKSHDVPKTPDRGEPGPQPLAVRLVDKPNATQSNIVIAGPALSRRSPDLYGAVLDNYVLGGGAFSSRLMKVVRSEGGKTYGASSRFTGKRDPGPFHVTTFTRNSETVPTLKLLFGQLVKMRESGPTDTELAAAKDNIIGGYGLSLETAIDVAGRLVSAVVLGLDDDFVQKYPERVAAVNRADAATIAGKYFVPTALAIVGKASEVAPQLEAAGWKPGETVIYTAPVSASERPKPAAAVQATPAEEVAGKKLLADALAAEGPLGSVENVVMTGQGKMSMQGHEIPAKVQSWRVPSKHAERVDIDVGIAKMTTLIANGTGVAKMGDKVMQEEPVPDEQVMLGSVFVLSWASWAPDVKVKALGAETVEGKKYDVLQVVGPKGASSKVYLDPATHLIARLVVDSNGEQETETLGDYQKVGGVQFPTHIVVDSQGARTDFTYNTVKINQKIPDDTFKK